MNTHNQLILTCIILVATTLSSFAQDSAIYLNAESDSKPREISLGLPTNSLGAVQIFEDGLPVSHYIYQCMPYKSWHAGACTEFNGSMSPFEAAMRYGEINTFVDSHNKLGSDKFRGTLSYTIGSFGQQKIDLNVSGSLGKGWKYSVSTYQNFDPGSNALQQRNLKDRHQFYKVALSRDFKDGNGRLSIIYQYAGYDTILDNNGPFVFVGDGSVKPFNGFSLGTDCYVPDLQSFQYVDFATGQMKEHPYMDIDKSHTATLLLDRDIAEGMHLQFRSRFKSGNSSRGSGTLAGIESVDASYGYTYASGQEFSGYVQKRSLIQFEANENGWMNNAELKFAAGRHNLRTGLDYQLHFDSDVSSTLIFAHDVKVNPRVLYKDGSVFGNFNSSGEYYDGVEHKAAVYAKDDWSIRDGLSLSGFLRLEDVNVHGKSANNIGDDTSNSRRPGFTLAEAKITPFSENFLNGSAGLDFNWRIAGGLSFTAQGIVTRVHNTLYDYGGFTYPSNDPTDTRFVQAGFSFVRKNLNVVSRLVYITQTNYKTRTTFQHALQHPVGNLPAGYIESLVLPITYGIESIGWTTDAIVSTNGGFNLHMQFTLRDPKYKDFVFSPTFSDGVTEHYDFSGNSVTALHRMELTLDPSYSFKSWRFWLTARYISRQYINKTNTLFFNGRLETFGGIDYRLNSNCRFSLNIINILNQKGASGNIGPADLVTDTSAYQNYLMSGKFIRPFTLELTASINF